MIKRREKLCTVSVLWHHAVQKGFISNIGTQNALILQITQLTHAECTESCNMFIFW